MGPYGSVTRYSLPAWCKCRDGPADARVCESRELPQVATRTDCSYERGPRNVLNTLASHSAPVHPARLAIERQHHNCEVRDLAQQLSANSGGRRDPAGPQDQHVHPADNGQKRIEWSLDVADKRHVWLIGDD